MFDSEAVGRNIIFSNPAKIIRRLSKCRNTGIVSAEPTKVLGQYINAERIIYYDDGVTAYIDNDGCITYFDNDGYLVEKPRGNPITPPIRL